MDKGFLNAYVRLLIHTCHRRGIHAMGGMAAQIPIKNDPAANEAALARVRADKLREVTAGHDGTWVAHPGLVPVAKAIFDERMSAPNQIGSREPVAGVAATELLAVPVGSITEHGLRANIDVGIQYLEAWLSGNGCVPIYHLMEDAATAEISRSQVWQWLRHGAHLDDGRAVSRELVEGIIAELRPQATPAARLFERMMTSADFTEFLTLLAYEQLA
jgi:malate synthase